MIKIFSRIGFLKIIVSDSEKSLIVNLMTEQYKLLGIEKYTTTPYHKSNGLVEKF